MIDLRCHVLPGLGDGPADESSALDLLAALQGEGVETAVATPRLHDGLDAREIAARCAELQRAGEQSGLNVRVAGGAQVPLSWLMDAPPSAVRAASLGANGTDVLIEVPHGRLPGTFEADLDAVMRAGYRVTLASPCVSADFQHRPERLLRLIDAGALVQVTARALIRGGGRTPSAALARELVASELCHVLAGDAHSAGPWRAPDLRRGVLEAARLCGARAEWMVQDAPAAILAGDPLPKPPAGAVSDRGLAWLRRRAEV